MADDHWAIVTANPRLTGRLYVDKNALYRFRLFRDGKLTWETNAPSTWIAIPSHADMVIFVGQQWGEGGASDGMNVLERVYAYDPSGKQLAFVDASPVLRPRALADGRFLYMSQGSIRLIDLSRQGKLVWEAPFESAFELDVFPGERLFAVVTYLRETREHATTLFDLETGQSLTSLVDAVDAYPRFLAVSRDQEFVFTRRCRQVDSYACDVAVYAVGEWDKPVLILKDLPGSPFGADRQADGVVAIGYVVPSPDGSSSQLEPRLEVRDSTGALLFARSFAPSKIDHRRASVHFDDSGDMLSFLCDSDEYIFVRIDEAPEEQH